MWAPLLLCGVAACGGKIAPLPDAGDAGEDADARSAEENADTGDDAGLDPVVDSVTPSSGPNSGGTSVVIRGDGFVGDGGTQITFAGFPASNVVCESAHECVAVTPYAGEASTDQVVHVQATVGGLLGDPAAHSSAMRAQDQFTFLAGPPCTGAIVCIGMDFPKLSIACPVPVSFYDQPMTSQQVLVGTGETLTVDTSTTGGDVAACYGDPATTSCSTFSIFEPVWSICGAPDFCVACKSVGGACGTDEYGNPTCTRNPFPPGGS
jgi:hypothetical protein